jgi:hypothetical protein
LSSATGPAGPPGVAALPPDWLADGALPLSTVPAETALFRVHRTSHGPLYFGPAVDPATGAREPPSNRFDSITGAFDVLYAGQHFAGAFAETILRNPQLRFVSRSYVAHRAVTEISAGRDLRMVDFQGPGLSAVGLTNAISTGPYEPCWAWSDYLWAHPDRPDGIAYISRHDPQQVCYALFERPDLSFKAGPATRFTLIEAQIRALLHRYGKIITWP